MPVVGEVKSQHSPSFAIYALVSVASQVCPLQCWAEWDKRVVQDQDHSSRMSYGTVLPLCLCRTVTILPQREEGEGGIALKPGNCCLTKQNPKQNKKHKWATFAPYLYGEGFSWRMWLEFIYIFPLRSLALSVNRHIKELLSHRSQGNWTRAAKQKSIRLLVCLMWFCSALSSARVLWKA